MTEDEKPSIHECLIGIDSSLHAISETLEMLCSTLERALEGDGDEEAGIIGTANSYGKRTYKFIRTSNIGD